MPAVVIDIASLRTASRKPSPAYDEELVEALVAQGYRPVGTSVPAEVIPMSMPRRNARTRRRA